MKNILLVGLMGSGKDTFASLIPHTRIAFADALKDIARLLRENDVTMAHQKMNKYFNYKPPVDMWDALYRFFEYPVEKPKDRMLLQELGTDWARYYYEDVWINALKCNLKLNESYIITDCRFLNEFNAFPDFLRIYIETDLSIRRKRIIERDGSHNEASEKHKSEQEIEQMKDQCDLIVVNNGNLESLQQQANEILKLCEVTNVSL